MVRKSGLILMLEMYAVITVAIAGLVVPPAVQAAELSFPVDSPRHEVTLQTAEGISKTLVDNAAYFYLADEGLPALPYRVIGVVLPQGTEVDDWSITVGGRTALADNFKPELAPPLRTYEGAAAASNPLTNWSADGKRFPESRGRYLGTGYLHGYAVASWAVFPFTVEEGALVLSENVTLHVTTRPSAAEGLVVSRERYREGFRQKVQKQLSSIVVNPEAAGYYSFNERQVAKKPGGFQPTSFPSLEGSPVDYVIITNDSLASAYQQLADWKTTKGIPTVIRTTEWIEANYRNGVDLQETIRNFVKDAYSKWGITYLLLGGDTGQVPARLAHSWFYDEAGGGRDLPVDMYYVCLDGNWNADRDHIFGERPYGFHTDEDNPDLYAELYVGRLPTTSVANVNLMVNKIINYETPVDPSFTNRILFLAEVLFPIDWVEPKPINMNGADLAQFVYLVSMTDPGLDVIRLYETEYLYPGSIDENAPAAIDTLNTGVNHAIHIGHGFRFNMSVGNGSIYNWDADALTNADRYSNFYILTCTAVDYTYYCLGEHLMTAPNGGAASVVGSNESAFPNAANYYMDKYYALMFEDDVYHIGEVFERSRVARTHLAILGDNVDLWTHYIYTILADPTMALWTNAVDTLQVTHTSSVNLGTNSILVTVNSGGSPVDSALVCLSKGDDDYQYGFTNVSGQATFDFRAESPGEIRVVATGLNYVRYEGLITVNGSTGAYVSLNDMTVDDDNTGGTSGNGDGVIDAGETVDLTLEMVNSGISSSGSVTLKLRSGDGNVVIVDSLATVGVVAGSGGTQWASDAFRVQFSSGLGDEAAVNFDLAVLEGGVDAWEDTFSKVVHAPVLEMVTIRIDDSAMGNGDGVVDAGEYFDLYYGIKNYGTGAAYGLTAGLADLENGFIFTDSTDTYPDLPAMTEAENLNGFLIMEEAVYIEHDLEITIIDAYGRTYVDTFELRPPDEPSNLAFDPKLGPDRLLVTWDASTSADAARYNVYQSQTPGGPYSPISVDPVEHTRFLDVGLLPSTIYFYIVTAIDSSGNESAASAEGFGSTNPGQIDGWPIVMGDPTVSSPAIGDIDGDGDLEIVQGSMTLYAWHHDGAELVDGDGDAQTWGVLTTLGSSYVSPVALAKIDGQPGVDIIAASRDTREVYVFDYKGDVIAGWPQPVENYIRAGLVAGDINGDKILEVIAIDEKGVLYVWNYNGTEYRDGDSNPATQGVFARFPGCNLQYSAPAIADIDDDTLKEIIVGTTNDSLYVLNEDGTSVPGWPYYLAADVSGSVAVGDIDDDGDLEIVANTYGGSVLALHHNATTLWSRWFPNYIFFAPSPALGDMTGDGKLECAVPSGNGRLYVIKSTGANQGGFPVYYSDYTYTESSPIIADVDGDGNPDVILGDESQFIKAWDASGNLVAGFPLATGDAMRAVPAIEDVDLDGDLDMIAAGWDQTVYVWDFQQAYDADDAWWSCYHGNRHNDGLVGSELPTGIAGASFSYQIRGSKVELAFVLPATAGYLFDVSRAELANPGDEGSTGVFSRVAAGLAAGADGVLRYYDSGVEMGTHYVYRLESSVDPEVNYTTHAVYVSVTRGSLVQNYPNPFNPSTRIKFYVPDGQAQRVSLIVYDVRGARVKTLVDESRRGGKYVVEWDGRNDRGDLVASGVYFYRLVEKNFTQTKKMLLIK